MEINACYTHHTVRRQYGERRSLENVGRREEHAKVHGVWFIANCGQTKVVEYTEFSLSILLCLVTFFLCPRLTLHLHMCHTLPHIHKGNIAVPHDYKDKFGIIILQLSRAQVMVFCILRYTLIKNKDLFWLIVSVHRQAAFNFCIIMCDTCCFAEN